MMKTKKKTLSVTGELRRELGFSDAFAVGLGAVIGAGIFVVLGVAAGMTGPSLVISLLIAGTAASFNGLSSAQLAARFPTAGGSYEYGYELLHPMAGFSAGWMFLASKLAAGGVVALGLGSYLQRFWPALDIRWTATAAVILLMAANMSGIKKTGWLNRVIVGITVLSLLYFSAAGSTKFDSGNMQPFATDGFRGIAAASAVLFFAFTGYARIATLGGEVKEPRRTIPRAIIATLGASIILYVVVALAALGTVGAEALSSEGAPLFTAAAAMDWPGIMTIIGIAAITAMLGVLLSQILGTSRMFYAMGRRGDAPQAFGQVTAGSAVPVWGIVLSGAVILTTIWLGELVAVTQAASFTILIYYSITNLAALRLESKDRLLPRWISLAGLVLCVLMAISLPLATIISGLLLLLAGHVYRLILRGFVARSKS